MPTSFLSADAGFPRLTADVPMEERLNRVQSYLYMLLEQLRYVLSNLGAENFNEAALAEIGEQMTAGLRSVVTDLEGNVSSLEQTATSLTSRISDAEGNISTLAQTATSLTSRITDAEGNVSSLQQTATSLTSRISDAEGNISTLAQTATSLTSRITDAEGNISQVSQTADKINWIVAGGTSASTMTMTQEAIDLIAQEINISGYVTFSSLENAGQSVINGDNIELKADADGDSVSHLTYTSVLGNTFAQIYTRDNRSDSTLDQNRYAFVIETPDFVDGGYCALKLVAGDSMSLESGYLLYLAAESQVVINNGIYATRIQADRAYSMNNRYPADCYVFCSDGIYYGGVKIVST